MNTTPQLTGEEPAGRLRRLIERDEIARAIGAHTPLSAVLAEEVGFDVVWASGLEISAAAAVPDANILSLNEVLATGAAMANAVTIPVLADCDSGFGNVNNVAYLVRAYEQRGVAGICIEDKLYPKLNSFVPGTQELAPIEDFAAKIAAAVDNRRSLVVVARLESLIAGEGIEDALLRAHVYESAGADALLIHSRLAIPDEVFEFRRRYRGQLPVIVVPTTYNQVTAVELEARGFGMAIYANQALRSSISAMRSTLTRIYEDGTSHFVEDGIASVKDVFRLQRQDEMLAAQDRYELEGRLITEIGVKR